MTNPPPSPRQQPFTYVWFTGCDRRAVHTRFEVVHVIFVHKSERVERVLSCDSRKNKSDSGSVYYALERVRVESVFDVAGKGYRVWAYDKLRVCFGVYHMRHTHVQIRSYMAVAAGVGGGGGELFDAGAGHTRTIKQNARSKNFHNFIAFLINATGLWRTYRTRFGTHLGNYYKKYP